MAVDRKQFAVHTAIVFFAQSGSVDAPLVVNCLRPAANFATPVPGGNCVGAGIEKMLVSPQHPPLRVLENRMSVPSGDQVGHMSYTVPSLLKLVAPVPSLFMAHTCQVPQQGLLNCDMKVILVLSGDHAGLRFSSSITIRSASPLPSGFTVTICHVLNAPPLRTPANAIFVPSGDHAGSSSS